jgi:hypothetical protein
MCGGGASDAEGWLQSGQTASEAKQAERSEPRSVAATPKAAQPQKNNYNSCYARLCDLGIRGQAHHDAPKPAAGCSNVLQHFLFLA